MNTLQPVYGMEDVDPSFNQYQYSFHQSPYVGIQEHELERLRQVQQQAVRQQQEAILYQQIVSKEQDQMQHQEQPPHQPPVQQPPMPPVPVQQMLLQQQQQQQQQQQLQQLQQQQQQLQQIQQQQLHQQYQHQLHQLQQQQQQQMMPSPEDHFSQVTYSPPVMNENLVMRARKRADHNAIERARRETLNSKFQQLAHSLPNLYNERRPSKGIIIERTLAYVKATVKKEEEFQSQIDELREANRKLFMKMVSSDDDIEEEDEDEDEDEKDCEELRNTPDCEDNFSTKSSVTSHNSDIIYHGTTYDNTLLMSSYDQLVQPWYSNNMDLSIEDDMKGYYQ